MRVAFYVRVSTERQQQAQTIEQQVAQLRSYVAARDGWEVDEAHIFRDDGFSGGKLVRPGLDALRDQAARAAFDLILITAPDRLARNYVHQMVVLEELERRSVRVVFIDRPPSDDPHDQLVLQIRGAVAEYERRLIADRMRRGRLARLRSGPLLPWTRAPYGYRLHPERPRDPAAVQVDPAAAAIIQELFATYAEGGVTVPGLAVRLTGRAVPTPTGQAIWKPSTIRGLLTNPAYRGEATSGRLRTTPSRGRRSPLEPVGRGAGTGARLGRAVRTGSAATGCQSAGRPSQHDPPVPPARPGQLWRLSTGMCRLHALDHRDALSLLPLSREVGSRQLRPRRALPSAVHPDGTTRRPRVG